MFAEIGGRLLQAAVFCVFPFPSVRAFGAPPATTVCVDFFCLVFPSLPQVSNPLLPWSGAFLAALYSLSC